MLFRELDLYLMAHANRHLLLPVLHDGAVHDHVGLAGRGVSVFVAVLLAVNLALAQLAILLEIFKIRGVFGRLYLETATQQTVQEFEFRGVNPLVGLVHTVHIMPLDLDEEALHVFLLFPVRAHGSLRVVRLAFVFILRFGHFKDYLPGVRFCG